MTDIADILKLTVKPHDRMSYLVTSSAGKKEYLVDLLAQGGAGQCSCPQWELRIQPVLNGRDAEDGWIPGCKHIYRCQLFLAQGMISELVKQKFV